MDRIIIIGTGLFGLSTADHVRKRYPATPLSIISRPSPLAPSDDIAKIVRVDYNNVDRMTEAVELQKQWNNDHFTDGYRKIGRVTIFEHGDFATIDQINKAREKLSLPRRETSGNELMQDRFGTKTAPESLIYVFNSDDAIVDWELIISQARARARAACVDSGGSFYESEVTTLVHDNDKGRIIEVVLKNGVRIQTETAQVILATGPWLGQDLATSGISLPPSGRTPTANGLFAYAVQLNDDQAEYFRNRPIHVEDLSSSALAKSHMYKAIAWARKFLPALRGARITSVTSFWDGITQTHDPIVARHPQLQNLVCAAGGSFNRAKDLPTIGNIVADVLDGQPVHDRYGWDPEMRYSHHDEPSLLSRGDFAAMDEQAKGDLEQGPVVPEQSCLAVI
ncbi:hypothetical protein N7474_010462 [Penicillium riverlandense]|uniref:uncharacterized protein n=1 Tax=Penicillium riverlandense TaxID=1903569 RepID=UPI002546766E|nr:uncharacterized protein N7474_010462 [Penicillium riverlandense]KAJ5806870.1 hypothetical protein N7474_010462 [Penicillium riverlandense]